MIVRFTARRIRLGFLFLGIALSLTGCAEPEGYTRKSETTTGETIYSTKYETADSPVLNAFRFLKNFTGIKESRRSSYSVIRQRYYQAGRYTMNIEYTTGMFTMTSVEEVLDKSWVEKHLARVGRSYLMKDLKTYRSGETYGLYAQSGDCTVMRFVTKLKGMIADNDQGNPDVIVFYSGCRGLTVSPVEFMRRLALATPEDEALFEQIGKQKPSAAAPAATPPVAVERQGGNREWQRRSFAAEFAQTGEKLYGTMYLSQDGHGGQFRFTLPRPRDKCSGMFHLTSKTDGLWNFTCANGLAADGSLVAYGRGKGAAGEGTDAKGQTVKFWIEKQ